MSLEDTCDRCGKVPTYQDVGFCAPCVREIMKPPFTALKEALANGSNLIQSDDGRVWIYGRHYDNRRSYFMANLGHFSETQLTVGLACRLKFKPYYSMTNVVKLP